MKKAGAKNDGKWFRLNKALHEDWVENEGNNTGGIQNRLLSTEEAKFNLEGAPVSNEAIVNAYFAALQDIAAKTGVNMPASPEDGPGLITRYRQIGFPRQVYMGKLSFDTYTLVGGKYKADHQEIAHVMGKLVRKVLSEWHYSQRTLNDLTDTGLQGEGNPGGQPDSVQGN